MIDRHTFWNGARPIFGGPKQSQVDGTNAILDAWDARPEFTDLRWLAYMLATVFWETAHTMQPIEEYGKGMGHEYGWADPETGRNYYGRGFVQLTWKANYEKMAKLTGEDLVNHPELALKPKVATQILFDGMRDGSFTGVGLSKYFNGHVEDSVNARRIINGTDHAHDISAIYHQFLGGLT